VIQSSQRYRRDESLQWWKDTGGNYEVTMYDDKLPVVKSFWMFCSLAHSDLTAVDS